MILFCSVTGNRFLLDPCPYRHLFPKYQGFRKASLDLKAKCFSPHHLQITTTNHYKAAMVLAKFNDYSNLLGVVQDCWLPHGYEDSNEFYFTAPLKLLSLATIRVLCLSFWTVFKQMVQETIKLPRILYVFSKFTVRRKHQGNFTTPSNNQTL